MYRKVHSSFWTDPKVRKLSLTSKLLFLYLVTGPQSHVSGIFYLPIGVGAHEIGSTVTSFSKSLEDLIKLGLVCYDFDLEVVWIVNGLKYQGGGPKISACISKHLKTLHNTPLVAMFLERYQGFNIEYQYPIDTPSIQYQYPIPIKEQEQEQEQEQDNSTTGTRKTKRPKPSSDVTLLREDLDKIEANLDTYKTKFSKDDLDIDKAFRDFQSYVLTGDARKPYPNPSKWTDLARAFNDSCKRAIERGWHRKQPKTNDPFNGFWEIPE